MRDRIDAEIWNAHHDQFSQWMADTARRARGPLIGAARRARVPAQMLAAVAAVSLTGLSLGTLFV